MDPLSYPHPAELDGDPEEVGAAATRQLAEASLVHARHVYATVQQVRSAYLSRMLREDPNLTPAELAGLWDSSRAAAVCGALVRAARVGKQAADSLVEKG